MITRQQPALQGASERHAPSAPVSRDAFFRGHEAARPIYDALAALIATLGRAEVRVTKSQIAFRRRRAFAWAWVPGRYLRGARPPLVLSLSLPRRHRGERWKEIVEPRPGRFMHHVELWSEKDLDQQVRAWLLEAWDAAA
jgi:Ser/Thr protein kinase RdoA (MazF antagonist)